MSVVTRRVSVMALSLLVAAPCLAQSLGEFRPTGDMTAPRARHTATRLHDGKILIVGGRSTNDPSGCAGTTSAELYDPASHTFTPTGKMTAVRRYHSATLLADGRVLIAGGEVHFSGGYCRPDPNRPSAEVYDPSSGTFTPTGDMIGYQNGHTATLLPNGRVLIAGGWVLGVWYTTSEQPGTVRPVDGHIQSHWCFCGCFCGSRFCVCDRRPLCIGGRCALRRQGSDCRRADLRTLRPSHRHVRADRCYDGDPTCVGTYADVRPRCLPTDWFC